MKILAIDPGNTKTGWCIYDTSTHKVLDKGITENYGFKLWIKSAIENKLFDCVGLEMIISYGMSVGQDVFETCLYIGMIMQIMDDAFKDCTLINRRQVKQAICNNGKAKDSHIRQALIDQFPLSGGGKTPQIGTKKEPGPLYGVTAHIWAALAVGITLAKDLGKYNPPINNNLTGFMAENNKKF